MRYMGADIDHIDIWRKPGPREHTCLYRRGGGSYDDPTANAAIGRVAAEERRQNERDAQAAVLSLEQRRKRLVRIIEEYEEMEKEVRQRRRDRMKDRSKLTIPVAATVAGTLAEQEETAARREQDEGIRS